MRIQFLLMVSCILVQFSYAQTSYQKVFSVNGSSTSGEAMVHTADGGFAIAGETNVSGNAESFLSKFDATGNNLWTEVYFDQKSNSQLNGVNDTQILCNQYLKYFITDSDGGFVFGGGIDSSVTITYSNGVMVGLDYNRIYSMKTDSQGNLVWANKFGLNDLDWSDALIEESHTGNLVMIGSVNQAGFVSRDDLIMKLDAQGNLIWAKSFGGNFDEGASSLVEAANGDFVICGTSESFSTNMDIYGLRMDSTGNIIWSKHFGSTGFDYGKSVMNASDGGFYFFGNAGATNPSYICLFKTDSDGAVQWANTYGAYPLDGPQALFKLADGNFAAIVYHYTSSYNSAVVEIDSNGNYILNRDYGETGNSQNDFLTDILPDGAFNLLCGASNSYSGNQFSNQVYLIRTHDDLESDCNTDELNFPATALTLTTGDAITNPVTAPIQQYPMLITQIDSFITADTLCIAVYTAVADMYSSQESIGLNPNPASVNTTIQIHDVKFSSGKLMITDLRGKILQFKRIEESVVSVDVSGLSDGIYFVTIENNSGKLGVQKLIVAH